MNVLGCRGTHWLVVNFVAGGILWTIVTGKCSPPLCGSTSRCSWVTAPPEGQGPAAKANWATEFEQIMTNYPLNYEFQIEGDEIRYKALGITDRGRLLIVVIDNSRAPSENCNCLRCKQADAESL